MLNYGRRYIYNLSEKISSLQNKLTEEQKKYKEINNKGVTRWDTDKIRITLKNDQLQEVANIKKEIKEQKIIYQPQSGDTLVIQTDASETHWAGILFAIPPKHPHVNSVSKPGSEAKINQLAPEISAYCSGKFKGPEKNYATYDKELLAIKNTINSLKIYLLSSEFFIETDNQAVAQFLKKKINSLIEKNVRRNRWSIELENYIYTFRYILGFTNIGADFLSRHG